MKCLNGPAIHEWCQVLKSTNFTRCFRDKQKHRCESPALNVPPSSPRFFWENQCILTHFVVRFVIFSLLDSNLKNCVLYKVVPSFQSTDKIMVLQSSTSLDPVYDAYY